LIILIIPTILQPLLKQFSIEVLYFGDIAEPEKSIMYTTAKMLFDMMVGISEAPKKNLSQEDRREICSGISLNNEIVTMQKSIESVELKMNNTYSIHTQVKELVPTIDTNILIKPETKSTLKLRIENLLALLKQAIPIDTHKQEKEKQDIDTSLTQLTYYSFRGVN